MKLKLEQFAIERTGGDTVYTEARNFRVDRAGHLVFYSWSWKKEAVFKDGTWIRAMRGVGPGDLTNVN